MLAVVLALTLAATVFCAPAVAAKPACAGRYAFAHKCSVRPIQLGIGAHGLLEGITWQSWGGPSVIGAGTLTVSGFAGDPSSGIGPTPGAVTLFKPVKCRGKRWYSRITVTYGANFTSYYQHNDLWGPPC